MDGSKLARDLLPPLLYRALTAVNPNAISLVTLFFWAALEMWGDFRCLSKTSL